MHSIKKILLSLISISFLSNTCQENWLPGEVWQPIIIQVLINKPTDGRNLIHVSKQLYAVMQTPDVIKTALAEREHKIVSHYELAVKMRIPAITIPYICANEKLLYTIELITYQEGLTNNPYADINYEGRIRKNKLEMICADYPEYKLNWIKWLVKHGARDNNTHVPETTALGTIIQRCYYLHRSCTGTQCNAIKNTAYEIVTMLLDTSGSNPSIHIHKAIDAHYAPIVHLLIEHGATIKRHDYVWFHDYLKCGHVDEDALKFLLDQRYNPYKSGYRPCDYVCFGQHFFVLENAIHTVKKLPRSEKRERILDLLYQYPKNTSE